MVASRVPLLLLGGAALLVIACSGPARPSDAEARRGIAGQVPPGTEGPQLAADVGRPAAPEFDAASTGHGSAGVPAGAHPLLRRGLARFSSACCVGQGGCTPHGCPPSASRSDVAVEGGMSAEAATAVIRRRGGTLTPCWWGVVAREAATVRTRAEITWMIGEDGRPSGTVARTGPVSNAELEACLEDTMRRWVFPPSAATRVSVALTFEPFAAP
jgi:hypothetical protein